MRIGFVTGEYPPMEGGVGAFTQALGRALHALGHSIYVFTSLDALGGAEKGIDVRPAVERWNWATPREMRDWALGNALEIVNVQFQTAAFDMHPSAHFLPRAIDSIPVAVTFHDLRVPYLFPKAGPLRDYALRLLAREADLSIATDRQDERRLRDDWNVPNITRIPIGSNVAAPSRHPTGFLRTAWREQLAVGPDDLLVGYFGFLNATKGARELIAALKIINDHEINAHLVMIGGKVGASDVTNVTYGNLVEKEIDALGLADRVHWTGFADDATVSAHFLAADVVALPYVDGASLRRGSLMAALAHGRAIVTTEPGIDTPELTQPPAASFIPSPPTPEALADAIEGLWRNTHHRRELETAARKAARHFTWDTIARQTMAEFEKLVGQSA